MADITYHADPNVISYIGEKVRKDTFYLGIGTEIPAGADLDNYKTPGMYYTVYSNMPANSPTVAQSDESTPVYDLAILRVMSSYGGNFIQRYESYMTGLSYTRGFFNGVWNPWVCNGGADSIVAQGKTNGWHWFKFASGKALCYGRSNPQIRANLWTQFGSLYRAVGPVENYPFAFSEVPAIAFNTNAQGSWWGNAINASRWSFAPAIFNTGKLTSDTNITYDVCVFGRWK